MRLHVNSAKLWLFVFVPVGVLFILINSLYFHNAADAKLELRRRSVVSEWDTTTNDSNNKISPDTTNVIIKLFDRANQAIEFFETNFEQLNPDGLFGVRIAQGSLTRTWSREYPEHLGGDRDFKWLLDLFKTRLDTLASKAYESVRANEPEYSNSFDLFISQPYYSGFDKETSIGTNQAATSSSEVAERESSFDEKFSDACYMNLLAKKKKHEPCVTIPTECLQYYADRDASGYFLTHQLLFVLIAQKSGECGEMAMLSLVSHLSKNPKSRRDLTELIGRDPVREDVRYALADYYCARIYTEVLESNETFFNTGRLPHGIDLFTEQLLLCSLANVKEFKTNEFVEVIFLHQNRHGCFDGDDYEKEDAEYRKGMIRLLKKKHEMNRREIESLSSVVFESKKRQQRQRLDKRRVRREDRLMNDGCSSHATGLALAYYSTLIEANFEQLVNNNKN